MDAPAGLDPSNGDLAVEQIHLYRVAGAPVKAARAFRKILGAQLSPWRPWPNGIGTGWPASIWTDGATTWLLPRPGQQRPRREPPSAGKQWETDGNIAFHLSSSSEVCRAVALAKAGLSLALDRSPGNNVMAREALRNLAYIWKIKDFPRER